MQHEVVTRAESARGEVVVRRRDDGALELRVNGVFVMDDVETSTERRLARAALDVAARPARVLVGGLGLGYTLRELLADRRVEHVLVAEIEPAVVTWMRSGVLPGAEALADPRVRVVAGDVRDVVQEYAAVGGESFDVVLLDVDNGPGFLVHDANAAVYTAPFLATCAGILADLGVLGVWSSTYSTALDAALRATCGECTALAVPVVLQGRAEHYWLFTSTMKR